MKPALMLFFTLGLCSSVHSMEYRFLSLDIPGSRSTHVTDINDDNVAVGYFVTQEFYRDPFIWQEGEFVHPVLEQVELSSFDGITNNGTIFGDGFVDSGNSRLLYTIQGNDLTTLDFPGAQRAFIQGINDRNEAVGFGFDGPFHLNHNEESAEVAFEGYSGVWVSDINNRGEIVGRVIREDTSLGFLLDEDGVQFFTHPSGTSSFLGINDHGLVAGSVFTKNSSRGFVFDGLDYHDVTFPDATRTEPMAINNHGVIAGRYLIDGAYKGFVAFPVPEPSTGAMLLVAILMLPVRRRKGSLRRLCSRVDQRSLGLDKRELLRLGA